MRRDIKSGADGKRTEATKVEQPPKAERSAKGQRQPKWSSHQKWSGPQKVRGNQCVERHPLGVEYVACGEPQATFFILPIDIGGEKGIMRLTYEQLFICSRDANPAYYSV